MHVFNEWSEICGLSPPSIIYGVPSSGSTVTREIVVFATILMTNMNQTENIKLFLQCESLAVFG